MTLKLLGSDESLQSTKFASKQRARFRIALQLTKNLQPRLMVAALEFSVLFKDVHGGIFCDGVTLSDPSITSNILTRPDQLMMTPEVDFSKYSV